MSAANSAAMDRHLKKIYDCLNIGCNKKAVQEVDRLPKKVRDMPVFKALKSLALIRMYKRSQAFEILNEINHDEDLDEVTLQTITSCYKESVDVSRIVDLYEAAVRRKPNDPEIVAHLFMAYVRVFNFKRQKEIAMQMYKNFANKKRLYTFWAITSLVMQSNDNTKICAEDTPDKKVCLTLAERMCEKMIDDERTHEEIELYLMILRKQKKYEEEYRFLTGPVCSRITDHLSWFNRRRAHLCLDLKMYSRAFKHYFPTLIQEYPDQIEYYQGLFKSALLIEIEAPNQQQQPVTNSGQQQTPPQTTGTPVKSCSALAECFDIVEKQCQASSESLETAKDSKGKSQPPQKSLSRTSSLNSNRRSTLRGPFIARTELYHTILSNATILPKSTYNLCMNQFSNKFPDLSSLLLDFFQSFSKKIICFNDMDYMINRFEMSNADKADLVSRVEQWIQDVQRNPNDISAYDLFHMVLNYHLLEHFLFNYKVSDKLEERLKKARKYIDLYDAHRELGKNTNKTEFQPVDHYCLLAINSITTNSLDLNNLTSQAILSNSVLISLIVMAENAMANSPSNHQIKLVLLKLYNLIGASKSSSDVLLSVDIKHFQIDTMGHLLNPVLYNTGNYTPSRESLETCLEFYAHGIRECFEGLTASYRDGRYNKIEEISNVLRRLCDSLNATQCVLLKGAVANTSASTYDELTAACKSFDPFKGLYRMFRCPNCSDNIKDSRDFKVLKSLHMQTNHLISRRKIETLQDEELWMKLRYYLLRSAYIQLEISNGSQKRPDNRDDPLNNVDELKYGLDQVNNLLPKIKEAKSNNHDVAFSFLEPESSPFRWAHIEFDSFVQLIKPLVFCPDAHNLTQKDLDHYSQNLDFITNKLETQLNSINSLVGMKLALLSLTMFIEFLSLCVTSLISLSQIESSVSTNSINNQASSKSIPSQQQQLPTFKSKSIPHQLVLKTEVHLTKISNMIKNIDPRVLILDKVSEVEDSLLSNSNQLTLTTKDNCPLNPILGRDITQSTLKKVKEKILESYTDSLKEIESTCRKKAKLLRSRT